MALDCSFWRRAPRTSAQATRALRQAQGRPPRPQRPTSSPPTIAANGDPFCDLAVQAQADARQLDNATGEFSTQMTNVVSGTAPVSDLNASGSTLYDIANSSTTFYDDAAPYVAGTDAESDFVEMKGFVTTYSMPLALMDARPVTARPSSRRWAPSSRPPRSSRPSLPAPQPFNASPHTSLTGAPPR